MTMKVLVVGGGGREHAIACALSRSEEVVLLSVMPKHNPGIASLSSDVLIEKETNIPAVVDFAVSRGADYAVIGPEAPLEAGIVDRLEKRGIPCIGPILKAAMLETDKAFCREMMHRHGIAGCPHYRTFYHADDAIRFIRNYDGDLAIKPIGLTGGKGVRIMGEHLDREGAVSYVRSLEGRVVLEERLIGEEFTLQAFVDGKHIVPMLIQTYVPLRGSRPITGGMSSTRCARLPSSRRRMTKAFGIMKEVVKVMGESGTPYRGVLYGQFMNTARGPMVIEFNARFGDPEAMNVLSLLESDLSSIITRMISGSLSEKEVKFARKATVCKYIVPEGYPDAPRTGEPVVLGDTPDTLLYYANVEESEGTLYTQSSRTLAFVGIGDTLDAAEHSAESAARSVKGRVRYRRDIGTAALLQKRISHMKELR